MYLTLISLFVVPPTWKSRVWNGNENDISKMWHTEMRYLSGCDFHIVLSTDDKAKQEVRDGSTVEWKKAEQT